MPSERLRWMRDFLRLKDLRQLASWFLLALRTVRGSGRGLFAVTIAVTVATGLVAVALSVAMANMIGSAPGVLTAGFESPAGRRLGRAASVYIVLLAIQGLVAVVQTASAQWVSRQVDGRLRERVMRATLAPAGVRHLEDSTMRAAMEQARNAAPTHGMT